MVYESASDDTSLSRKLRRERYPHRSLDATKTIELVLPGNLESQAIFNALYEVLVYHAGCKLVAFGPVWFDSRTMHPRRSRVMERIGNGSATRFVSKTYQQRAAL